MWEATAVEGETGTCEKKTSGETFLRPSAEPFYQLNLPPTYRKLCKTLLLRYRYARFLQTFSNLPHLFRGDKKFCKNDEPRRNRRIKKREKKKNLRFPELSVRVLYLIAKENEKLSLNFHLSFSFNVQKSSKVANPESNDVEVEVFVWRWERREKL